MKIEFYKEFGENGYLANYSNHGFYKNGIYYKTVEHYYQSEKFDNVEIKNKIINSLTPKEASLIGRDKNNIRKKNFKKIKNDVMLEGVLEKFMQNKDILYKLIETRNSEIIENTIDEYYWGIGKDKSGQNNMGKILMKARDILKSEMLNKILGECTNKDIYILGHKNPDADSIFSSLVLNHALKFLGFKSHFCMLKDEYEYNEKDKKLIIDFLNEKPEIISNIEDKKFILVDHNNLEGLKKENVIGAIDHHIISNEVDKTLEIEYSSTGLLIYDLFKDRYGFDEEEKFLIGLTVLSDTEYLFSSRFTKEDKKLYNSLNLDIDVSNMQKQYFVTTNFSNSIEKTIKNNLKKYNYNGKNINRVLISTYENEFNKYFKKYSKHIDNSDECWLLIWCNYESKNTNVHFSKQNLCFDYITTSTYMILKELEKLNLI